MHAEHRSNRGHLHAFSRARPPPLPPPSPLPPPPSPPSTYPKSNRVTTQATDSRDLERSRDRHEVQGTLRAHYACISSARGSRVILVRSHRAVHCESSQTGWRLFLNRQGSSPFSVHFGPIRYRHEYWLDQSWTGCRIVFNAVDSKSFTEEKLGHIL